MGILPEIFDHAENDGDLHADVLLDAIDLESLKNAPQQEPPEPPEPPNP